MALTPSSSSSSLDSLNSFDEVPVNICRVKFLCSHGGRILPRYPDGRLRYVGGETRVLAVDRSLSFSGLQAKLKELCGWESVNLRCRLPTEDLDALISVTSDEDLANLIEEYELSRRDPRNPIKIRAFLHPNAVKSTKSAKSESTPPRIPITPMVPMSKASIRHSAIFAPVSRCIYPVTFPAKNAVRFDRSGDVSLFHGYSTARHCLVNPGHHQQ